MKYTLYRFLPSWSDSLHAKRRKGWRRCAEARHPGQFGQQLQDLVLFENILRRKKGGVYWEFGASDGVVGLHSFALETFHGWDGVLVEHEPRPLPWRTAQARRKAQFLPAAPGDFPAAWKILPEKYSRPDLVASHAEAWNEAVVAAIEADRLRPRVLILQLPRADIRWGRRLKPFYRLAFAFHDDEYYVARKP